MATDDTSTLTKLGAGTRYAYERPEASILEAFENSAKHRDYMIELVFPEFTSLCPVTGQPDFATIIVRYVPNRLCVESKSFKLYLVAYRNQGSFMETITNKVLDDLVTVCEPKWISVIGRFNARGGTSITVTAEEGLNPLQSSPSVPR
jgi:7-cyano-7-deazaguanine reductase